MAALRIVIIGTIATTTACAPGAATKPFRSGPPDTWKQAKVRRDLDDCNASTGYRGYRLTVTPEGRYEFDADNRFLAAPMLECMRRKGYTAAIVEKAEAGAWEGRRVAGVGE